MKQVRKLNSFARYAQTSSGRPIRRPKNVAITCGR